MSQSAFFSVLVPVNTGQNTEQNSVKYKPLYWYDYDTVIKVYEEDSEDDCIEYILDKYTEFCLLDVYEPYPLSYFLFGTINPVYRSLDPDIQNLKTYVTNRRFEGKSWKGFPEGTDQVMRLVLPLKGNNCVSCLISDILKDSFDTVYTDKDNKQCNLKDYPTTKQLLQLLSRVSKEWKDAILVVVLG